MEKFEDNLPDIILCDLCGKEINRYDAFKVHLCDDIDEGYIGLICEECNEKILLTIW